jgi:hypothetical protein
MLRQLRAVPCDGMAKMCRPHWHRRAIPNRVVEA